MIKFDEEMIFVNAFIDVQSYSMDDEVSINISVDEAAKQCGRTRLPAVRPIEPLTDWLAARAARADAALLFCYENEERQPMQAALRALPASVREITLLVGPEGGFTLAEAEAITRAGGVSVTLGPRILRAETAAVAAMSIVQYERGDLGSEAVSLIGEA